MEGIWVEVQVIENMDYDFCIYSIDQDVVMRENVQPNPGDMLIIVDTIIPTLKYYIEKVPQKKRGILVFNKEKKEEQEM